MISFIYQKKQGPYKNTIKFIPKQNETPKKLKLVIISLSSQTQLSNEKTNDF